MCEPDDSNESRSPSESEADPALSSVEPSNYPRESCQFIEPHPAIDWLTKVVLVVLIGMTLLWVCKMMMLLNGYGSAYNPSPPEELTQDQVIWEQSFTVYWDLKRLDSSSEEHPAGSLCTLEAQLHRKVSLESSFLNTPIRVKCGEDVLFDSRDLSDETPLNCSVNQVRTDDDSEESYSYDLSCELDSQYLKTDNLMVVLYSDSNLLVVGSEDHPEYFMGIKSERSHPVPHPPLIPPQSTVLSSDEEVVWSQEQTLIWDASVVQDGRWGLPVGVPCTLTAMVSHRARAESQRTDTQLLLECEGTRIWDSRTLPNGDFNPVECGFSQFTTRVADVFLYQIACQRNANAFLDGDLFIDIDRVSDQIVIRGWDESDQFVATLQESSRPRMLPPLFRLEPKTRPSFDTFVVEATVTKETSGVPLNQGERCLIQVDDQWSTDACWVRLECTEEHDKTDGKASCWLDNGMVQTIRFQTESRDPVLLDLDLNQQVGTITLDKAVIPLSLAEPEVLDDCPLGWGQIRGYRDGFDLCLYSGFPVPDSPTLRGECDAIRTQGWLGFSWESLSDSLAYRCPAQGQQVVEGDRQFCRWEVDLISDQLLNVICDDFRSEGRLAYFLGEGP